jgi:hypothetical protein
MSYMNAGAKGQCVEFDYYNGKDTAVDLAREMVEDLNLTPEDAQAIVQAISFEVARVKGELMCCTCDVLLVSPDVMDLKTSFAEGTTMSTFSPPNQVTSLMLIRLPSGRDHFVALLF